MYIGYYCILIVFCTVGLRVLHGLMNLNQSNQSISLSNERNFVSYPCHTTRSGFFSYSNFGPDFGWGKQYNKNVNPTFRIISSNYNNYYNLIVLIMKFKSIFEFKDSKAYKIYLYTRVYLEGIPAQIDLAVTLTICSFFPRNM